VQREPSATSLQRWCLFLDVDGTLLEPAATPEAVNVPPELRVRLAVLADALQGALALISGRTLASLDVLFAPLSLAAAGSHGLQRRDARGALHGASGPDPRLAPVREALKVLVHQHPGLLLEDKSRSLALHYRRAPTLGSLAQAQTLRAATTLGDPYIVLEGDHVYEIKPRQPDKGAAVDAFMQEAPFRGRLPVFVGDDHTDRDAMVVVKRFGGLTIAVGDRITADRQLANPRAVRRWLGSLLLMGDPLQGGGSA
jgi:trehalose 6-phosphate phosphatase